MARSFAVVRRSLLPLSRCALVLLIAFFSWISVQSQDSSAPSTLRGTVRDVHGSAIPSVFVSLQPKEGVQTLTTHTDAQGVFSFSPLREGVYALRAEMTGYLDAAVPSIFLAVKETKSVDLTLEPANAGSPKPTSAEKPQFFDEPQFTVSGVTDTTSLGGHGSETIVRTREAVAREAVVLGKASAVAGSAASALEKSQPERLERDPQSFDANHQLGKTLLENRRAAEAIAYLDRAATLKPEDYENSYDRALANFDAGHYDLAREQAQALLRHQDTAELHHLLADTQEKLGNSLDAVREYQRAAELDPREPYFFDWGSELLLHHAPEPAIEVFARGNHLFPQSVRMLIGMGAASFVRGDFDQAVRHLIAASALAPDDPDPYLFLGKMEMSQAKLPDDLVAMQQRFAARHPESAAANYYCAVALWKQQKNSPGSDSAATVESLLRNAIRIDPNFAAAHLQLGIVYSDTRDFAKAIAEYQQAIQVSQGAASGEGGPADPEEAHYRLANAYRASGQPDKAKAEFQIYDQMSKESAEKTERERRQMRQFLYTLRGQPAGQ